MPDVIDSLKVAHRSATPPAPFDLDESIRRGRRRRHRRRVASAGVGVAIATGAAIAAFVLPGASPDRPEPADEVTFAILDEPQREEDELPPSIRQQQPQGLDLSSTRLVGEYAGLRYWLGTNDEDQVCVVASEDGTWRSTACGGVPAVARPGMSGMPGILGMNHQSTSPGLTSAYVLPDGMELEIDEHAGLLVLSENLAISFMADRTRAELAGVLEDAAEYFSAFAEPQLPRDRLPEAQNRSDWRVPAAATRYVGEYRDVRYWIGALENDAPEEHRQICLIGVTDSGEWRGTTCSDPLNLSGGGPHWPLERIDPEDSTRLALVPDGYELTDEQADTWEQVAPNVFHDTASE